MKVPDWIAAGLSALVLGGCGAPAEREPESLAAPLSEQRVVLGTGEAEFEPIDGEPRLELVAGVQGGFHVWASFLVYGTTSDRIDMVLETRVADDPEQSIVMRARVNLREGVDADGQPVRSFAGFPAQVYDARCAQDRRVSLSLELTDEGGAAFGDTRACIADVPEQRQGSDCE